MTYTTTAGKLGHDQADAEVRFQDRNGVMRQGLMGEVAHYTQPDLEKEVDVMPRTVGVRFVGEPTAYFLNPDVQITVAGDKPA